MCSSSMVCGASFSTTWWPGVFVSLFVVSRRPRLLSDLLWTEINRGARRSGREKNIHVGLVKSDFVADQPSSDFCVSHKCRAEELFSLRPQPPAIVFFLLLLLVLLKRSGCCAGCYGSQRLAVSSRGLVPRDVCTPSNTPVPPSSASLCSAFSIGR